MPNVITNMHKRQIHVYFFAEAQLANFVGGGATAPSLPPSCASVYNSSNCRTLRGSITHPSKTSSKYNIGLDKVN